MSTDFRPLGPIRLADLFDGRLENIGVHEHPSEEATANRRCLTDGRNFLWVKGDENGFVSTFTRYGMNAPQRILRAIGDEFALEIVSEYEPKYWAYKTQEEWDVAWTEMAEKDEHDFYNEVAKFIRGKSHGIQPGTIGKTADSRLP
jgi:hypothetical protein